MVQEASTGNLMKVGEVAKLLGVTPWMVDKLRRDGRLPSVRIGARNHRYLPRDVEDTIQKLRSV